MKIFGLVEVKAKSGGCDLDFQKVAKRAEVFEREDILEMRDALCNMRRVASYD